MSEPRLEAGPDDACAECYRKGWEAGHRALDVERLARAIKAEGESGRWDGADDRAMKFMSETLAAFIAAEYERLSE